MLLFKGQKAPVTQSKRRGFGLTVQIPALKEKKHGKAAHGALKASKEGESMALCLQGLCDGGALHGRGVPVCPWQHPGLVLMEETAAAAPLPPLV